MGRILTVVFLFLIINNTSHAFELDPRIDPEFVEALVKVENQKQDPQAIGDKHLANKSYGLFQIRHPYLEDVNRIAGEFILTRKWGKKHLTIHDMKDQHKAEWVLRVYLSHYGRVYTKKTGRLPTYREYARIHNGGPNGWQKSSTISFAEKVLLQLNKERG